MGNMGFCLPEWGNDLDTVCFKRKFRWKLIIPTISADGVNSLPPSKANRPGLSFREITVEHLNESIPFPGKPEWKPIQLTLYDLHKGMENPVFTWIRRQYNVKPAECAYWRPCLAAPTFVIPQVSLIMFDGCGSTLESWIFEHVWPQNVEFGDLDMQNSEVCMVDLTLKYHRAYIATPSTIPTLSWPEQIADFACGVSQISWIPPSAISITSMMMVEPVRMAEFKVQRW